MTDKTSALPAPSEQALARLAQVLWSIPVAAAVEPWVTPRWAPADPAPANGVAGRTRD